MPVQPRQGSRGTGLVKTCRHLSDVELSPKTLGLRFYIWAAAPARKEKNATMKAFVQLENAAEICVTAGWVGTGLCYDFRLKELIDSVDTWETRAPAGAARGPITSLLAEFSHGNRDVEDELAALVYGELRRLASAHMRRERANHTLQPTALVHELWARLADGRTVAWQNRTHFFAIASHHMRQILVDHARRRSAAKRGGGGRQITLEAHLLGEERNLVDLLALNEALDRLKAIDQRAYRVVELHFFGGLSFEEMALVLKVSDRTIKRDWRMARAWLHSQLAESQ
jgi:RNA polymerase sigma factor (TIGR02999 family)